MGDPLPLRYASRFTVISRTFDTRAQLTTDRGVKMITHWKEGTFVSLLGKHKTLPDSVVLTNTPEITNAQNLLYRWHNIGSLKKNQQISKCQDFVKGYPIDFVQK